MSDYDDDMQDEMMDAFYEDNPDMLTPEEVFSLVLLNKRKKTRMSIEIRDEDGDLIDHVELMEELVNYIKDKLDDEEGNQIVDQIMPLMSQSLVSGLGRLAGIPATAFMVSSPNTRMSLIYMMMVAFIMYKMVQMKGLTIHTIEEDVSEEEIEEIERKSKASSVASMSSMMGMDHKEILQQMVETGEITQEDLEDLLGTKKDSGDDN